MPIPDFELKPSEDQVESFIRRNDTARKELSDLEAWLKELAGMTEEERMNYIPPEESRTRFRAKVLDIYEEGPLTKEEIEESFTTDNLRRLSLEEYVALLRKVPAKFITHITRHGFCDRTSHHHFDKESFHHGFEGLLAGRNIQSGMDRIAEGEWDKDKVRLMLREIGIPSEYCKTRGDAVEILNEFSRRSVTGLPTSDFTDLNAVHGALDYVADWYYGSEIGNQIFVLYPAAFVASQYESTSQNGNVPDNFAQPKDSRHDARNDIWMMRKGDERGILPLDAGIVFIPANARVNPNTGSKYEIAENGSREEGSPLTQESISSQEYWENYFNRTGYRPSKIIYYDEEDPNEALEEFRRKARLPDSLHDGLNLKTMFQTSTMGLRDMDAKMAARKQEFKNLAEGIINEMYPAGDILPDWLKASE